MTANKKKNNTSAKVATISTNMSFGERINSIAANLPQDLSKLEEKTTRRLFSDGVSTFSETDKNVDKTKIIKE